STNKLITQRAEYVSLSQQSAKAFLDSEELTQAMEQREIEKQKAIASAKMPVKGLSFGDGEVLMNGIPLNQASHADRIRISCAIGMAGNPKLRVLIIYDGEKLDSVGMKILAEMARKNDFQIWLERVDESGQVGIVMEDGHVKEQAK